MESRQVNPVLNLFNEIQKIIEFMELKDQKEADLYETEAIRNESSIWMGAMLEDDDHLIYRRFWNIAMFQEVQFNVPLNHIQIWLENPMSVPLKFHANLRRRGRQLFLNQYEEQNAYYRTIAGLIPLDSSSEDWVYLSRSACRQFDILFDSENQRSAFPLHQLSTLIQNRFMLSDEFKQIPKDEPNKRYLNYLGIYSIDIFTARRARDFEIIRFIPMDRSDINPNLLKEFGSLYNEYRDYVMKILYNRELEGLYQGYRSFMKILIMSFTLLQIPNKAVEHVSDRRFLDDAVLHIILSMHGIPRSLLMTKEVRRNLVIHLLRITREKATDDVYYSLVKILGYQDVIISKLMLMKGQEFGDNEEAQFLPEFGSTPDPLNNFGNLDETTTLNEYGRPDKHVNVHPYFTAVDLKDNNPYDTITKGLAKDYDYRYVTDEDPQWWDMTPTEEDFTETVNQSDVQEILLDRHYTVADSKYITIDAVIHQIRYMFESIFFTRMILDNKNYTDNFDMTIPEIFGTDPVSVYDAMVFVVAVTCMNNRLKGTIMSQNYPVLATAGFNFDMDQDLFMEFLNNTKYVDRNRVERFIENLSMRVPSDISRLFNDVIYPMREWLERQMSRTDNRHEFLEYESIYRALFTYDINRNSFMDHFKSPMEIIRESLELSDADMLAFRYFYPRTSQGLAMTEIDRPFIDHLHLITWYVDIPSKGRLFFHDILNSPDLRFEYDENGIIYQKDKNDEYILDEYNRRIGKFNMLFWEENPLYENGDPVTDGEGNQIYEYLPDYEAIRDAREAIDALDDNELRHAFFWQNSYAQETSDRFTAGELLPQYIRRIHTFKEILDQKIHMDMRGYAQPAATYHGYLERKNPQLFKLLRTDLYPTNDDSYCSEMEPNIYDCYFEEKFKTWQEIVMPTAMTIVLALETELNMHMKYFEQSVVGSELFFRPLITLINHYKSTYISIARAGLKYVFGDKVDAGGNSNMLRFFDNVRTIMHFVIMSRRGERAEFGLYDTEPRVIYRAVMKDRPTMITIDNDVSNRKVSTGSIRMVDEMKFFLNGRPIDNRDKVNPDYVPEYLPNPEWEVLINKGVPELIKNPDYVLQYIPNPEYHDGINDGIPELIKNPHWIEGIKLIDHNENTPLWIKHDDPGREYIDNPDWTPSQILNPDWTEGINDGIPELIKNPKYVPKLIPNPKWYEGINGDTPQFIPWQHHSMWYSGEPGVGRWSEEDDVLMRTRFGTERITQINPVDTEGWKDYIESYNPI